MGDGLSIANNLLANSARLHLDTNQKQLRKVTTQLSSGLRVNDATDDPSGLAIATELQTQVDGLDQASSNVQNANNAAQVALGALTATTSILQRIRNIAVEASSDINSPSDRTNLQTEVSQLLLEINRISQNTNFNGEPLLDGSHSGFQPAQNAFLTVTSNAALASAGNGDVTGPLNNLLTNGNFASPLYANNSNQAGPATIPGWTLNFMGITNGNPGFFPPLPPGQQSIYFRGPGSNAFQTINNLIPGQGYTLSFDAGAPGVAPFQAQVNGVPTPVNPPVGSYQTFTVNFTANAAGTATIKFTAPNWFANITNVQVLPNIAGVVSGFNTGFLIASAVAANSNFNTTAGNYQGYGISGNPYATVDGSIELQVINTGVSIAAQESFINSATGQVSVSSILLSPLAISDNFENVLIATGNFGTADVGVTSFIKISQNVAALTSPNNPAFAIHSGANEGDVVSVGIGATNTQTLRVSNINVAQSGSSAALGSEDAIGQVDNALTTLLTQQAQLGALVVRLHVDQDSDNTAASNFQGAESNIRDANIGQATTQFTKLEVLVQVGTSVLAQSNLNANSVTALFK